jgi:hypothetical protein
MPPTYVIVLLVLMAAAAVWAIRADRVRTRRKAELLASMGFRTVEAADPQAAEALLALFKRGHERARPLRFSKVFRSDQAVGQVYVFDVVDPGSRRRSQLATSAVGVVRRGAGLPAMEVWGFSKEGGPMDQLMATLVGKWLHHGEVVPFEDPAFARRFTVVAAGAGEVAVRATLGAGVREALGKMHFMGLSAEGDAFALQANPYSAENRGDEIGTLRRLIEEAPAVARALESTEASFGGAAPG